MVLVPTESPTVIEGVHFSSIQIAAIALTLARGGAMVFGHEVGMTDWNKYMPDDRQNFIRYMEAYLAKP